MQRRSIIISTILFLALAASASCPARAAAGLTVRHVAPDGPSRKIAAKKAREESLQSCCERLMNARRNIYYLNARSYKMSFQLRAIYAREETMFFCLGLSNHAQVNYSIDSIRFYIADEKQVAGIRTRSPSLLPLCVYGNTRIIRGKTKEFCVFALPRFTLPARKLLVIEVSERNGGRRLQLLADNYSLVRARLA